MLSFMTCAGTVWHHPGWEPAGRRMWTPCRLPGGLLEGNTPAQQQPSKPSSEPHHGHSRPGCLSWARLQPAGTSANLSAQEYGSVAWHGRCCGQRGERGRACCLKSKSKNVIWEGEGGTKPELCKHEGGVQRNPVYSVYKNTGQLRYTSVEVRSEFLTYELLD